MKHFWPKESRILRSREFRRVQKNGRKWKSRDFLFLYLPNQKNQVRIGLVVSKKVGNAVVRNRVKRRLREIFRSKIHSYLKGVDIVVIVFSSFVEKELPCIEEQCKRALFGIVKKV